MTDETPGTEPAEDAPLSPPQEAADSSPADTPEQTADAQPDETGKPTEQDNLSEKVQKRFDQLTWEREQARREAAYWQQLASRQPAEPEPPEPPKALPKLEDYGYDEAKYQAALVDYAAQQSRAIVESRLSEVIQQAREQKRVETFAERQRAFAKSAPDFEAKVLRDPTLPINEGMREVILDSDSGPEIAYYLANNRQVAEQIAALPPHLAALEMGRIEGRLSAQKETAKRPQVSSAPPPPPKVESADVSDTGVRASDPESDKLDMNEWMRRRNKEISAARARSFIKR